MKGTPITKEKIEDMKRLIQENKDIEERKLAQERPSGHITVPTGNALDYEWLFDELIAEMDKLHERIKVLES